MMGEIQCGITGPIAINTRLGLVLLGPAHHFRQIYRQQALLQSTHWQLEQSPLMTMI